MAKILVVDDEPDTLELVKISLEQAGHTSLLALDGKMGLELAARLRPDLAIVDVMMPEMDGYEFCTRLRQLPRVGAIPILILTGRRHVEAESIAAKVGATGFLGKPFDPMVLAEAVSRLLHSADPTTAVPHDFERALAGIVSKAAARDPRVPVGSESATVATRPGAEVSVFELFPRGVPDLLALLAERGGSDLHVKAGSPPGLRVHGELIPVACRKLSSDETEALLLPVLPEAQRAAFEADNECDFAISLPGVARFRVNVFRQRGAMGAVARMIPVRVKTLEELAMPPVLAELASRPRGLVLVTGPTGSGKSTTLAAMIHHINLTRRCHILTLEDPIEFLHEDRMSYVNQREIGSDSRSFQAALKRALRQDPDVIFVGEMRDLETISAAVTAAETGHLVFGTLHTTGAAATVDRIVDAFPADQQAQVRLQVASGLEGVVSQVLLPRADGTGRAAALEILVGTAAVRNLIRESKTHQISSVIQGGASLGMIPLNSSLRELLKKGIITLPAALAVSPDPAELKAQFRLAA